MTSTDPALTRAYDNSSSKTNDTPASQGYSKPRHTPSVNVSEVERAVSVAIGAIVVAKGLTRLSVPALLIAGAGAALINRGLSGHCSLYEKMGIDTAE